MSILVRSSFLAIALASVAFGAMAADPVVDENTGRDWTGMYAGLKYVRGFGGNWNATNNGVQFVQGTEAGGNMFGGFVGYNMQRGRLVYGAELAGQFGSYTLDGWPTFNRYPYFADMKARLGYATDRVLVFAAVGGMIGQYNENDVNLFALTGFTLGGGVDVMVTDKIFVGGEITHRIFKGDDPDRPAIDWHGSNTEASLRVGIRF